MNEVKDLHKARSITHLAVLVTGPSILVYILVENKKMYQNITLLPCLVKRSYMFRPTNATIRELISSSQATYMPVCITRRIMEFRLN
jgi:hypothetical protein